MTFDDRVKAAWGELPSSNDVTVADVERMLRAAVPEVWGAEPVGWIAPNEVSGHMINASWNPVGEYEACRVYERMRNAHLKNPYYLTR